MGFFEVGMIEVISSLIGLNCGTVIFLSISKINFEIGFGGGVNFSGPYDM